MITAATADLIEELNQAYHQKELAARAASEAVTSKDLAKAERALKKAEAKYNRLAARADKLF